MDAKYCEQFVWGIGAKDCSSYVEPEERGIVVGDWGLQPAVKESVIRSLMFSVSGGGGGAMALDANVSMRVRCAGWLFGSTFRFFLGGGGGGHMRFLSSCVRGVFGGGAFTKSGRLSG